MSILRAIFAYVNSLRRPSAAKVMLSIQPPVPAARVVVKRVPMTWRGIGGTAYRADEKPGWVIRKFRPVTGAPYYMLTTESAQESFGTLSRARRYAETIR